MRWLTAIRNIPDNIVVTICYRVRPPPVDVVPIIGRAAGYRECSDGLTAMHLPTATVAII